MIVAINGTRFRGGTITWRALNTTPSGTTAQILVRQRYAWRRSGFSPVCTAATVMAGSLIGSGTGTLACYAGGSCGSFTPSTADVFCTDYSALMDCSFGERYTNYTLPLNRTFVISFINNAWPALAIGGGANFAVTAKIDLTIRYNGVLNTPPLTWILPIYYRRINTQQIHLIQTIDYDYDNIPRCRWSTSNSPANANNYNECGSVCSPSLPTFTLFPNNCTLVYTITALSYYAVALQIEDYYSPSPTTPMSSVPLQFLFYGISPSGVCTIPPSIVGARNDKACIAVPIGILSNETIIAQVNCPNKSIIDFVMSSPLGLIKTAITNSSIGIYTINILFTPNANQYGPQEFCAAAVDNTNVQSDPWCVTFLVGHTPPSMQYGTAYPNGTVFATHSIFSIQAQSGVTVNRPVRNGSYVYFHEVNLNGTVVLQYDCGWSPNVTYFNNTMVIYAAFNWIPGHTYYITFDSGVMSRWDYCAAESAPITNPYFWRFDIYNVTTTTSTTTTTTTTATTTTTTTVTTATTMTTNSSGNAGGQSVDAISTTSAQDSSTIAGVVGGIVGGVLVLVILVGCLNYLKMRSKRRPRSIRDDVAETNETTFPTEVENVDSSTFSQRETNTRFDRTSTSRFRRPSKPVFNSKVNPITSYGEVPISKVDQTMPENIFNGRRYNIDIPQ